MSAAYTMPATPKRVLLIDDTRWTAEFLKEQFEALDWMADVITDLPPGGRGDDVPPIGAADQMIAEALNKVREKSAPLAQVVIFDFFFFTVNGGYRVNEELVKLGYERSQRVLFTKYREIMASVKKYDPALFREAEEYCEAIKKTGVCIVDKGTQQETIREAAIALVKAIVENRQPRCLE